MNEITNFYIVQYKKHVYCAVYKYLNNELHLMFEKTKQLVYMQMKCHLTFE